jgi:curli biogenesis system outer membrane secretion channel CsgG
LCFFIVLSACDKQNEQETTLPQSDTVASENQNSKIKIAVLSTTDFFPDRTVSQKMGLPEELAARIMEHLTKSNRFQVLERTALRKVINEQQFGQEDKESFLDKTLNSAIKNLPEVDGLAVAATSIAANNNDLIKDYQNLGSSIGADFLVFAVLEKVDNQRKNVDLPYSNGRSFTRNKTDARLRLRVINAKTGGIAGAASFRTQLTESLLNGQESSKDEFSTFDHLGGLAANKILDIAFPARIVSTDPLVINRGKNDGVSTGALFKVFREGKEISDGNGVVIGRIKTPVGTVRIGQVQDTLAIVERVEGDTKKGDLLEPEGQNNADSIEKKTYAGQTGKEKGKLTLAVGKIRINQAINFDEILPALIFQERVSNDLLVKLTNTNRFNVLDRQEVDQLLDEKMFNTLAQNQEIESRLKEFDEADFLIMISINDFILKGEHQKIAYVDEVQSRYYVVIDATLRIVDTHTGKLLTADKIRINKRLVNYNKNNKKTDTLYADVLNDFSDEIVKLAMQKLYPIRVIGLASNTDFYINRGADGGLKKGDLFKVMREGEEMFDPDTGISFGKTEQEIAQVNVAEVESARAKVHLISGQGVQRGDILKALDKPAKKVARPQIRKPNF